MGGVLICSADSLMIIISGVSVAYKRAKQLMKITVF